LDPHELSTDDRFVRRVRQSAHTVFGQTPIARQIESLCDDHAEARRSILQDRTGGVTVIAMVGATGQGKSWLIRQMIRRSDVATLVRSGNNSDEATEQLSWIGPSPPADLDSRHEAYFACAADQMESIDLPYVLVDAPGATDERRGIAAVAKRALSMATVLVLVVRRDQLRSHAVSVLTEASDGVLVVPVINAVRGEDATADADTESFVGRMRKAAPRSVIAKAVLVPDFDVGDRDEAAVGAQAAADLADRLQRIIADSGGGDRRQSTRLAALESRFRAALHSALRDQLPGLATAVESLHAETGQIPGQVAQSLLGGTASLRAAVRSRLRLGLMEETSPIWFPFRSLLGVLNLTSGAWDRLLLSLSGSLPSLIGTIWTGAGNIASGRDAATDVREGLLRRSSAVIDDRLRPLANQFRVELAKLRHEKVTSERNVDEGENPSRVARLTGLDTLQEKSQEIFHQVTRDALPGRLSTVSIGLIATLIFWGLMAGPIVALYQGYVTASYGVLGERSGDLNAFPRPDASMLLTSVLLSLLPTALFAMIIMSAVQSRRRVDRVETELRDQHHQTIQRLQRDGVMRLRWDDAVLGDAEFLLSIGMNGDDDPAGPPSQDLNA